MACSECGLDATVTVPKRTQSLSNRIGDLQQCNDYVHGAERVSLESFILSGKSHSTHLGHRIAVMKDHLEKFQKAQEAEDHWVALAARALHPARGIPREILSEIFLAVVRQTPPPSFEELRRGEFDDSLSMKTSAWPLSQVSSSWRKAALATSQLWTGVALNFDSYPNNISMVYLLDLYLSRSTTHNLNMYLFSSDEAFKTHRAFPTLLMSSPRWRSATFSILFEMYEQFAQAPGSFLALERITFDFQDDAEIRPGDQSPTIFRNGKAPLLKSITTSDPVAMAQFWLAWSQLSHYHSLGGTAPPLSNHTSLIILKGSTNLRSVTLTLGDSPAGMLVIAPFQLASLRSLNIRGPGQAIRDFCGNLIVPVLERLQYHSEDSLDAVFNDVPGASLIVSHGQTIKDVSVTVATCSVEEVAALVRMLNGTTSITRLELVMAENFDLEELFTALSVTKDRCVASSLETLVIKSIKDSVLSTALIRMIKSRRSGVEGVAFLKRVEVDYAEYEEDVHDEFASLLSEGLEGFILDEPSADLKEAVEQGFDRIL